MTTTIPESSSSKIRKLMRDMETEIRNLEDYSKFEEAKRCSIRESCAKKVEKYEKIQSLLSTTTLESSRSQIRGG